MPHSNFCISRPKKKKKKPKLPRVRDSSQALFVKVWGLDKHNHSRVKAGALILYPPCWLVSPLQAFSSPGKSETQNKGSKYFPFKLKMRESRVRINTFRKHGNISLLPTPTLPKALKETEENLEARGLASLGDSLFPSEDRPSWKRWVGEGQGSTFLESGGQTPAFWVPLEFCVWQPPLETERPQSLEAEITVGRVRMSKCLLTVPSVPPLPQGCEPAAHASREVVTRGGVPAQEGGSSSAGGGVAPSHWGPDAGTAPLGEGLPGGQATSGSRRGRLGQGGHLSSWCPLFPPSMSENVISVTLLARV